MKNSGSKRLITFIYKSLIYIYGNIDGLNGKSAFTCTEQISVCGKTSILHWRVNDFDYLSRYFLF